MNKRHYVTRSLTNRRNIVNIDSSIFRLYECISEWLKQLLDSFTSVFGNFCQPLC